MTGTSQAGKVIAASCLLLATMSGSVRCARLDLGEMTYRAALHPSAYEARPETGKDADKVTAGENTAIVAWIDSDEPDLSYPVVQPRKDTPRTWYLNHDAWGNASELGCPYLDIRSAGDGDHMLVYGHRIVGTDYIFSPLANAYIPEVFSVLGVMRWRPKQGRELLCTPLCAMRVKATYQPIQQFDFDDADSFKMWLQGIVEDASAVTHTAEALVSSATTAVTLVTCSGNLIGSDWRTLVVYAAG